MIKTVASVAIELLGLALLVFAAYLFDYRAAIIVGGLVLLLVGYALDTPAPRQGPKQ